MPDHARTQVRAAAVTAFTGLATTGARVFTARVAALGEAQMPGLNVMLREESAEWDAMGKILRTGQLVVEGYAQGGDGLEDTLDQIAAEVEAAFYASGSALDALLTNKGAPVTSVSLPEPAEGVARRTGVLRMLLPVMYRTAEADPTLVG